MTEPREPLRPDVWRDPVPDVVLPPAGQPLDLTQDPDRVQPGGPSPVSPFPAGVPLDPRNDPDRVQPGDRTLVDLLGEGAQEEARDGYTWLVGLLAVLAFLGLIAYGIRFLGP